MINSRFWLGLSLLLVAVGFTAAIVVALPILQAIDPLFWLGLSILMVAVSLTAVLVAALPALQELGRAARSAEKLFDTLNRELPPTLEAIRLTGMEISDLTDEVGEGVQSANRVVKQVDQSVSGVKKQAQKAQVSTRSVFSGVKVAWKVFTRSPSRRPVDRLPPSSKSSLDLQDTYSSQTPRGMSRSDVFKGYEDIYEDAENSPSLSDLENLSSPLEARETRKPPLEDV